jgi:hypothetical protein
VAEAAAGWIARCETDGLEGATIRGYRQHLELHILPPLGRQKLSKLSVPIDRGLQGRVAPGERVGADPARRRHHRTGAGVRDPARRRGADPHEPGLHPVVTATHPDGHDAEVRVRRIARERTG